MRKSVQAMIIFIVMLAGCAREPDIKSQSLQGKNMIKLNSDGAAQLGPVDQSVARQAVERIRAKKEIHDAVALNTNKKLLLAYQIKQMSRFRKQQIDQEVAKQLKKQFPDYQIVTSGDLKLFWKTNELRQRMQKDAINERELNQQIEKLKKLSEERT